jgi:hypothetical protein
MTTRGIHYEENLRRTQASNGRCNAIFGIPSSFPILSKSSFFIKRWIPAQKHCPNDGMTAVS